MSALRFDAHTHDKKDSICLSVYVFAKNGSSVSNTIWMTSDEAKRMGQMLVDEAAKAPRQASAADLGLEAA